MQDQVDALNATWVRAVRRLRIATAIGISVLALIIAWLLHERDWVIVLVFVITLIGVVAGGGLDPFAEFRLLRRGLLVAIREQWIVRMDDNDIEIQTKSLDVRVPLGRVRGAHLLVNGSSASRAVQDALYLDIGLRSSLAIPEAADGFGQLVEWLERKALLRREVL